MKRKWLLWVSITILIVLMLKQAFNQPGADDLSSGFEEVAVYRNENNTGPVKRLYVVTTGQPQNMEEMMAYGRLMPYTKLGETKVYFFEGGQPFPEDIKPEEPPFSTTFHPYCLAVFEKSFRSSKKRVWRDSRF